MGRFSPAAAACHQRKQTERDKTWPHVMCKKKEGSGNLEIQALLLAFVSHVFPSPAFCFLDCQMGKYGPPSDHRGPRAP